MNHYSLHEFNILVKDLLSEHLNPSYWIVAEIGQINLHSNGHCYLELVEKDNNYVKAKARGTIWANTFREIHPWFVSQTGTELKQGMKILLNASLEFHEVYGMSLNIKDIDVNFTIGERERKKQETLNRLEQEGVIEMNKLLELPLVVQRLAIISSKSAAGYEDFMNQFNSNPYKYSCQLDLYHSVMQGDTAPASIIDSLHQVYESDCDYDAVIVIRGGGSKMDLDCFDEYELCSHLAQFPLPVITGIGHERDQAIADIVANVQLKTPTSVAEFLISRMLSFESEINHFQETVNNRIQELLNSQTQSLNELNFRWKMSAKQIIQKNTIELEHTQEFIQKQPPVLLRKYYSNIDHVQQLIEAYNPENLMSKGYSITRVNGKLLKKQKVNSGDVLETQTASKKIISTVNNIQ